MPDELLLECKGFSAVDVVVPAFEILLGDTTAIVEPIETHRDRMALMSIVVGNAVGGNTTAHCRASVVDPLVYERTSNRNDTVHDVLTQYGIDESDSRDIIVASNLNPFVPYWHLQYSEKTVLGISISALQGARIIAASMSGLDPTGVARVLHHAKGLKDRCAVLAFFSESVVGYFESTGSIQRYCNKVVTIQRRGGTVDGEPTGE